MTDLVFWQYSISMHQSAFLRNIAVNNKVLLIVAQEWTENRKNLGWEMPDMTGVEIIIAPDDKKIKSVIESSPKAIHNFAGIDAFPFVFKAFKLAISYKLKIFVHLEPINLNGIKGGIRFLKYYMLRLRFNRYIDALLVTGLMARSCYEKMEFPANKIWDWAYFTEEQLYPLSESSLPNLNLPSFLYVGSLIERKNIIPILEEIKVLTDGISKFSIVGTGPLEIEVQKLAKENDKIKFIGKRSNSEVKELMRSHDYLVLPSLFDGWGAVVNEALMAGTRVIVSDQCGSSSLLQNGIRGFIFNLNGSPDIKKVFVEAIKLGVVGPETRNEIHLWAQQNITGKSAAEYFERIIQYLYEDLTIRPHAPWLSNNNIDHN